MQREVSCPHCDSITSFEIDANFEPVFELCDDCGKEFKVELDQAGNLRACADGLLCDDDNVEDEDAFCDDEEGSCED